MAQGEAKDRREIEAAVEQAAREELIGYRERRKANPTLRVADLVRSEPMALWFTYALIGETRRLRWLTIVLIALTAVLAVLTARLAFR